MLRLLRFILLAFLISAGVIWVSDHNGQVVITWLNYEIRTSILSAVIILLAFTLLVFAITYLLARILAIRFPTISKLFFGKSHVKRLEKLLKKNEKGLQTIVDLLMAIEVRDQKTAKKLQKQVSKLINNNQLDDFLTGKIAFDHRDYDKATDYFAKLNGQTAKVLLLKSKFNLALEKQEDDMAIAYAQQIISTVEHNDDITNKLLNLYKAKGMWKEAQDLLNQQKKKSALDSSLATRDVAVMNVALAHDYYHQKKYGLAIKHAKIALKAEEDFLPATEIVLKTWIKRGFITKASFMIKKMWRQHPHIILAEIYDLIHHKDSRSARIKAMKKLAALNDKTYLGYFAVGLTAFRVGDYDIAKEYLRLSLLKEKTHRAYKLLSYIEGVYGSEDKSRKYSQKAEEVSGSDHYTCGNCGHGSSRWNAKCMNCGEHDSLRWH